MGDKYAVSTVFSSSSMSNFTHMACMTDRMADASSAFCLRLVRVSLVRTFASLRRSLRGGVGVPCGMKEAYTNIHTLAHTHLISYIYTHAHAYTSSPIHTLTHTHLISYILSHIHIFTHTYIHMRMHTHLHSYIHTHAHTHALCIRTCR
jgi:hypothetical protein